ncbi:uncharacterized protein BDZ99DRAFT_143533 [Mytilinidion resinicola]|uniref:Glycosyl transferase CAP10 domain-containing protein n=1 Tax=Mytilinidion resinicola TaxID=574789 RepID=A0A6A6Y7J2_9PEZI|nr:uncharacterized protein BDZ99DRAFT_143533 [Mytilinidion resinicola]KAF2804811.1 hypothetical protein BDZ99DRAFT_143533 [Mytilinidion resinicola]
MIFQYQRAVGLACVAMFLFLVLSITILPLKTFDVLHFGSSSKNGQHAPTWNPTSNSSQSWTFQAPRDAKNYGLSPGQCDASFPALGHAIERSVAHRKEIGNIKPEDVNTGWRSDGIVHAMIYDNQLYIIEAKGCHRRDFRERSLAILQSIWRAVVSWPGPIPNIEFTFTIDDGAYEQGVSNENPPVTWSLTRKDEPLYDNLWLMADFGFYVWGATGDYNALRKAIKDDEIPFDKKDPRAVWRGGVLVEKEPQDLRKSLIDTAHDQKWADIDFFDWSQGKDGPSNWISIAQLCKYLFPVHTEGRTYSGRLKYILNCHSVSVVHKLQWEENFHHLLVAEGPQQNYIQVERDFSDLQQKIEHYLAHPDEARRIADNSVRVFRDRYLTPAAQACYWRKLFAAWRSVSFEPEFYMTVEEQERLELAKAGDDEEKKSQVAQKFEGKDRKARVPRGMPYEKYMLIESYEDSPW